MFWFRLKTTLLFKEGLIKTRWGSLNDNRPFQWKLQHIAKPTHMLDSHCALSTLVNQSSNFKTV